MNEAPLVDLDVGKFLERNLLAARCRHHDVADLLGIVPVLMFQPDDKIEFLFPLHHLGGDVAAYGGFDHAVDVADIQAIAGDLGPVDVDGQAWLSQFLHQRHVLDAAHIFQDFLDGLALLLKNLQIGTEHFDGQGALEPGFGFVHGVFRRLGVVEGDAGKAFQLAVDRRDQVRLVAIGTVPLRIGLEADIELDIEKAGGVGAVVRPSQFRTDGGDFGKGAQDVPHLGRDLGGLVEGNGVGHGGAHPQRAFIQLRHEFGADERDQKQRSRQQQAGHQGHFPGPGEAVIQPFHIARP